MTRIPNTSLGMDKNHTTCEIAIC